MPTFEALPRFWRDHRRLGKRKQQEFRSAVVLFTQGLEAGRFDPSLRVHRIEAAPGVWSMSWGNGGRATFQCGGQRKPGKAHIVWRRVGDHAIYGRP